MAQNLFTTLLHKTIFVVMSAGVIIAYTTLRNYLSNVIWLLLVVSKLLYPIWKKLYFFMGVLGNSWSSVWELAILLGVCLIHDCARVANGDSIKNYKLASLFWKTKYFICLFRDIYLSWFFKGANLFDISFYWIYAFVSVYFCANITFPPSTSL